MRPSKLIIIGITGSIGSGKTTVAKFFAKRTTRVIDADRIAHQLLSPKTTVGKKLIRYFGSGILNRYGSISRQKLSQIAFANNKNWQHLCRLTHPEVIRRIKKQTRRAYKAKLEAVIIDAALLIESGADRLVNYLIVVRASLKKQLIRTRARSGISTQDFRRRVRFQLPLKDKIKKADFIINNNRTPEFTERQVDQIWKKIMERKSRSKKK